MQNTSRHPFFVLLLVASTAAFLALAMVFWNAIFWAVVFGIVFRPLEVRLSARLKHHDSLAAALTVILIVFTVLIPAMLVTSAIASEAAVVYNRIHNGDLDLNSVQLWFQQRSPQLEEWLAKLGLEIGQITSRLSALIASSSQLAGSMALSAGQNLTSMVVSFILMLYLLFFVLRYGHQMIDVIHRAVPLPDELERRLFIKFAEVSRATVKGTVIIGLLQGTLGGMIFAVLGIHGAAFWGAMMAIASLIPAVGTSLIWAPAALLLLISGSWIKAAILVAFGVLAIGLLDNLLRPILVGRDTKMPDYLVLFSTLGGLALFGFTGLVLGPVIASLFLVVWQINSEDEEFYTENKTEDPSEDTAGEGTAELHTTITDQHQ